MAKIFLRLFVALSTFASFEALANTLNARVERAWFKGYTFGRFSTEHHFADFYFRPPFESEKAAGIAIAIRTMGTVLIDNRYIVAPIEAKLQMIGDGKWRGDGFIYLVEGGSDQATCGRPIQVDMEGPSTGALQVTIRRPALNLHCISTNGFFTEKVTFATEKKAMSPYNHPSLKPGSPFRQKP